MVIVIRYRDCASDRIDVDHFNLERFLQRGSYSMNSCASVAARVPASCILFYLDKSHAILVDNYQIDGAVALAGREDPIAKAQEMLDANNLANVAVDMPLVRQAPR